MGLAAFNRMRQLEAMKPENIKKEEEVKVEEKPAEVVAEIKEESIEAPIIETENQTTEEVENEAMEEVEDKPTRRRRTTK